MTLETPTNLPGLLRQRAAATPDKIVLRCDDEALTYSALLEAGGRVAAGLAGLGIARGDTVCLLLDTSADHVAAWLGINWLGAVEAPINTGFRGPALLRALTLTGAPVLILDSCYLAHVRDLLPQAPALRHLVIRGAFDATLAIEGIGISGFDAFAVPAPPPPIAVNAPSDTAQLLFTSGSTGPSKACRIPHRYVLGQPEIFCRELGLGADDTLFAPFPLFHVDGAIFTVAAAVHAGATAALQPRFSASRFWDDCRRHQATVFDYMGATLTMLFRKPAAPGERDHRLRLGWGVPLPPFAAEFERRFGLELVEVYGLSDAGIVLVNRPGEPRREGSCGRAVAPFDVRIHDDDGRELPDGEAGEIVIRSDDRFLITTGYEGDPEATEAAFRGDWFRTGDLARRDADGYFYFVGRLKDIIRRRGENISAFDVEQCLLAHPDIADAAAYGVPSELTEEDLMVAVVARGGATLDARALREWVAAHLAPHMIPRYVRIADALPRTPTEKVAKHILAGEGVTADSVDFEATAPVARAG